MSVRSDTDATLLTGPPLGHVIPNVATLLERNASLFASRRVFQEKRGETFEGPDWPEFVETIRTIAWRLRLLGLREGDRCAIVSPNRIEMLQMELAVMASGGIATPIFHGYPQHLLTQLITFCGASFLAVGGATQLERIDRSLPLERIIVFDDLAEEYFPSALRFSDLRADPCDPDFSLSIDADPGAVCLMQYTSGTSGTPKCVQLSHRNILSQRFALDPIWVAGEGSRILSYLPWHHSFGGIFELFNALARGVTMTLEPSYGKSPESILEHWKLIRPTAFFSVPRVYQALVDLTYGDPEGREALFHPELEFIFTAAAPLPDRVAKEFQSRGVRIVEGWGLTETSPCCTVTSASAWREAGVVGYPIAGVQIRIASDGEIQVRGPNVMCGYYDNPEANALAFTDDGWFRTGDIGQIGPGGVRLIGRRDRIFKLSNGEKVVSAEVENALQNACHLLAFAVVEGSGRMFPVALLFPNRKLLNGDVEINGCVCPHSLGELSNCLGRCLSQANGTIVQKFARVRYAVLIDDELSIENGTLTPSMKVIAKNVAESYRLTIEDLFAPEGPMREDIYIVPLRTDQSNQDCE
jgi:long-subunit acyl-CoA synthetase (AMP-forming)